MVLSIGILNSQDYSMIDVLEVIASIEAEKKSKHIVPSHALLSEIVAEIDKRVRPELNNLVSEGKVSWCETLNSYGFSIIKK